MGGSENNVSLTLSVNFSNFDSPLSLFNSAASYFPQVHAISPPAMYVEYIRGIHKGACGKNQTEPDLQGEGGLKRLDVRIKKGCRSVKGDMNFWTN